MVFVAAALCVGANAVILENGVIFWLSRHLLNPLAAF